MVIDISFCCDVSSIYKASEGTLTTMFLSPLVADLTRGGYACDKGLRATLVSCKSVYTRAMVDFGSMIRAVRTSSGLTQTDVAQGAGSSLGAIWKAEHDLGTVAYSNEYEAMIERMMANFDCVRLPKEAAAIGRRA